MSRDDRSLRLLPILLEALFVVFGVVLALLANEWRQERELEAKASTALAGIRAEIDANRAEIETAFQYHRERMATVGRHLQSGSDEPLPEQVFDRGYIYASTLRSDAWHAAVNTDAISHFDYAQVLEISRLYAEQARYEKQSDHLAPMIYRTILEDGRGAMLQHPRRLLTLVGMMAYREEALLNAFEETLASLDAPADR